MIYHHMSASFSLFNPVFPENSLSFDIDDTLCYKLIKHISGE